MAHQMSDQLTVTLRRDGDRLSITCRGGIDLVSRDQLCDTAIAAITEDQVRHVDVDITGVTFLAAAGARGLLRLQRAAAHHGATFELSRGPAWLERIVTITGLRHPVE
ncbi:STAS domain-containing protein [Actinosynnema sp. NPDC050436]|uniref:STAS domain-containing protein n=1 Tax=Actinosynnema sp. NPDC050436 TaxID=3155659 RepID=UPI0033C026A7